MKKRSIVLILALWATFFAGAVVQKQNNLVEVNIIVHGICNIQSHFNIPAIINFLKDTVENTYYYYNTQLYRQEPYFYQFQDRAYGDTMKAVFNQLN